MGGYWTPTEGLTASSLKAKLSKSLRLKTLWRLYVYETLLERLAQDREHMTAKLGPFIQEEDTVVAQRHVAGHQHVAPADQPRIRAGVRGGATRASRDQRGAVAGEAGNAVVMCAGLA